MKKEANNTKYFFKNVNYFYTLLVVFVFTNSFAQVTKPAAEHAFENQFYFNESYIKDQKIKSITFDIIDKKDLQIAEDKGLQTYYEFNSDGLLSRFYTISIAKVIQKEYQTKPVYKRGRKISNGSSYTRNEYIYDTISTIYLYNENKQQKLKRYNDGTYYESYYYDYNADGKISEEKRYKETNVSENKYEFKLGTQFLISKEKFNYLATAKNQTKKICMNDEGRPYKEIIFTYNDSSKLVSINEQYTVAWIIQNSSFTYNKKGQLISASYKSNSNGDVELTRSYEYDANDCILTEKQLKNGVLQKEISYITDANKKLTSYIIRDPNNKTIRIVKLIYQY